MRKFSFLPFLLVLLLLAACNDDDATTDPVIQTQDIAGGWNGERVVQSIAPVNHLLAIQLWNNISSNDPPLTMSGQCTQTGNDLTLRLTDSPSGYFIEYTGTISGEDISLTSSIVSFPPMVTRVTCSDGTDRHYDIQSSAISAIIHDGIFTGNIVTTAHAFISESGLADGEIEYDQTFDLTRTP